jgi:hypothetical protein
MSWFKFRRRISADGKPYICYIKLRGSFIPEVYFQNAPPIFTKVYSPGANNRPPFFSRRQIPVIVHGAPIITYSTFFQ